MSNTTERPVIEWLRTIADPIVRESAIAQCISTGTAISLEQALYRAFAWGGTHEGYGYWLDIKTKVVLGQLETLPTTNWMDEVHTMD